MINALHLLWIIPLAGGLGAFLMALIAVGDCDPPWYDHEDTALSPEQVAAMCGRHAQDYYDHDVSGLLEE